MKNVYKLNASLFTLLTAILFFQFSYADSVREDNHASQETTCVDRERLDSEKSLELAMNGPVYHGTHLCTDDQDCGTDHKCCSGHCKAVVTCNK